MSTFYGTVDDATSYFADRLYSTWADAATDDQPKALLAATRIIDSLCFKGQKHAVWQAWQVCHWPYRPTAEAIREASLSQPLEFPRDSDTIPPEDILHACYEIAMALLDGRDPEQELLSLAVSQQTYGPVQLTYSRDSEQFEHLRNGVPSLAAWRLLRPYLGSVNEFRVNRIS